jgi:hypothetical protein
MLSEAKTTPSRAIRPVNFFMIARADPRREPTSNSNLRKTVPSSEMEMAERRKNMADAVTASWSFCGSKVCGRPYTWKVFGGSSDAS